MKDKDIHWGILGAGKMASKFASDFSRVPGARLAAVGSLSKERALEVVKSYPGARAYGSYEELARDPQVDVVYVATHNPFHFPCVKMCLEAGKPVLCEKPFAMNAGEARQMVALARQRQLFLMEGLWTRFFPAVNELRRLIQSGAIGEVRLLNVNLGYAGDPDPQGRLLNPALGGGALLDIGVYAIGYAGMWFGQPLEVRSFAGQGPTGVDEHVTLMMQFADGQLATCNCSIRLHTYKEVDVIGTTGRIRVHEPCWKPHTLSLVHHGQPPQVISRPYEGLGYHFEIAEVMRCLREGKLESDLMPLRDSLQIMQVVDTCREQWGLHQQTHKSR